jgi:RND family efflux transporter MFP subunit
MEGYMRTALYFLFGIIAMVAALTSACSNDSQAKQGQQGPPAMPVKVEEVHARKVGDFTEYLATLRSRRSSVVQPQVEGQITKIFVHSGDHVSEGAPILQIDPMKQQATVNNLEATRQAKVATLQLAERELRRREELFKAGVISRQDLDQQQTAYDSAKADVEATGAGVREQQVQLHYYTVKAGGDGTVGDIPVRVGDRVTTQTVLTTLDLGGQLEAYVYVPADKSAELKVGTPVELIADDGSVLLRTAVTFVSPRVDPTSQLVLIKATVPNNEHRFRNEQVVHARVVWKESDRPTIPVTAVARISGQTFAYVAETNGGNSVAKQRTVKLGEIMGNEYVVLDGIKPGDKLITTGVQLLADGVPVKPQA